MIYLTGFWDSTLAGSIYGFFSALVIFSITMWYNEYSRKKAYERDLLKTFIDNNPKLIIILEDANNDLFDLIKIREAADTLYTFYLSNGELKNNLQELKRINNLSSNAFRNEKPKIKPLLRKIYAMLNHKKDALL